MKLIGAILFLTLISCSSSRIGIIGYEAFDHVEFVNGAIDRIGVKLNLSDDHSDGRGILATKGIISEKFDSTYTIVSIKGISSESFTIVNDVATNEGMLVLTTEVNNGKQRTTFEIKNWPSTILYKTTYSKLTLASKANEWGITSGKIEYKGKSGYGQEIILVNAFYFE